MICSSWRPLSFRIDALSIGYRPIDTVDHCVLNKANCINYVTFAGSIWSNKDVYLAEREVEMTYAAEMLDLDSAYHFACHNRL
jgi:hypothetical protein